MVSPLNLLFLFLLAGENTKDKGKHIQTKPIEEMRVVPLIVQGDTVITNLDALIECEIYREIGYEFRCWWDDEEKVKLYSILLFLRKRFEKLIGIEDEIAKSMIGKIKKENGKRNSEIEGSSKVVPEKKLGRDEKLGNKLADEGGERKGDKNDKENVGLIEMFGKIGLSAHRIQREAMKIKIFISKVKKNFLVDIEDLKSIIEERFLRRNYGSKSEGINRKEKSRKKSKRKKQQEKIGREKIEKGMYKHKKREKESEMDVQQYNQEDIIRREMEEIEEKITQEFINLLIPPDTKFYFE